MKTLSLAHMINPVKVGPDSDLYLAQQVTVSTLLQAAKEAPGDLSIALLATGFAEDLEDLPPGIQVTPPLNRSIRDLPEFNSTHKRLPLISDIFERFQQASDAEVFVFSNVDIAVVPEFYSVVAAHLRRGIDAFVINRRTISADFTDPGQIPEMIEQARSGGSPHPGYDCFVFLRRILSRFRLGNACVGANWSGRVLLANLIRHSRRFREFRDLRITFHIGDRRDWQEAKHNPYNFHNAVELASIVDRLMPGAEKKKNRWLQSLRDETGNGPCLDLNVPDHVTGKNSPSRSLSVPAGELYPAEFRPSSSWERFTSQKLRQDPVFVVGFPRSGTTLVQALLATQPDLVTFPETHFFSLVRAVLVLENDRISPQCLDRVVGRIRRRVEFSVEAETHVRKLASGAGLSPKMLFETMVVDILAGRFPQTAVHSLRWLEKTPDHLHHLDTIKRFYPAARIVCVMRNPEKAILSRKHNFHFNHESNWPVTRHAREWLRAMDALEAMQRRAPESVCVVRLEDLVRDQQKELAAICAFLDVKFNSSALAHYREIAQDLVYPWETWKNGVFKDISQQISAPSELRMNWRQRSMLDVLAGRKMSKYGYCPLWRRGFAALMQTLRWTKSLFRKALSRQNRSQPPSATPGRWPRKIDLGNQQDLFFGKHRCGWTFAVRCLLPLHQPGGIELDSFIERTFAWSASFKPHTRPWVGIIHIPPRVPDWFQSHQSNDTVLASEAWQQSLPFCRGLFTLSRYHRRHLEKRLDVPVEHLYFPTATPPLRWSWERFSANRDPRVVQIGWWLRKIHAIFQLSVENTRFRKVFLKIDYFDWDYLIRREREILLRKGEFNDDMYESAEQIGYVPDHDYDRLLAENVVFLNLYDSSANNTIIECMARTTPILVNPLEAVREYLGEDYPLYYGSLTEATEILREPDRIRAAHLYLSRPEIRGNLRSDRFVRDFAESEIYRNL